MNDMLLLLKDLREERSLTQKEIAAILDTSQQQYSKYETEDSELPVKTLIALADYYNVSIDYLTGRTSCREGLDGLNRAVLPGYSTGALISDVLSLREESRRSVKEYVDLQKLKQTQFPG